LDDRGVSTAVARSSTFPSAAIASGAEVSVNGHLFGQSTEEEPMLDMKSVMLMLLSTSWGVITAVLVIIVVYRGTLSAREDDQIFIDAAEQHYYEEQQTIIARMSRLRGPIVALSLVSSVLFLSTLGVWIYQGYSSF